jgi:hypothetical protein
LDEIDMPQTINLGSLQLKFLQSKEDTVGSLTHANLRH